MASYEELYNKIMEESVKGTIGRTGIKIAKSAGIIPDTDEKKKETDDKKEGLLDKYPVLKKTATTVGNVVASPIEKSSKVIAKKVVDAKETKLKKEFSNDAEKLEKKLKENVLRLDDLEKQIMTGEIMALSAVAIGPLQAALTAVLTAAGIAKNNAKLCSAVASAAVWVVPAMKKLNDATGGKLEESKAGQVVKSTVSKVIDALKSWAKSDEPLVKTSSEPVKESVVDSIQEELLYSVCESLLNEYITIDESMTLLEAIGIPEDF